jgi:uncharacterized membrane protein YedE/YeeE
MISKLITFLLGFSFATGLGISQMTRPQKILAFLDVLGSWDPSLLLVMAAAVGVYFPLQKYITGMGFPRYEAEFTLPKPGTIDRPLIMGAAIFGMGWGLVGFCPGPSVVALATGTPKVIVFVSGVILGMLCYTKLHKRAFKSAKKPR